MASARSFICSDYDPSRERAKSWSRSDSRHFQRPRRSLNQKTIPATFLNSLLKTDHDISSVVSDLPSFCGFKLPDNSLHSLKQRSGHAKANLDAILNDPYLNKEVASERLSRSSSLSFGASQHETRKIYQISNEPFRILDTPGMDDNYYSHLLAWSLKNIIAICLSETVYLFNYVSGDFSEVYQADRDESISSLAFSPNGDYLAIGNNDGFITVWDPETLLRITSKRLHNDRIACLDWNISGLLSGSKDTTVALSDPRTRRYDGRFFKGHTQEIVGLKWNHCGQMFASGGNDNQALVWSISSSDSRSFINCQHRAAVRALGWSHKTPGLLATGGGYSDAAIRTFDTKRQLLIDERETDGQICSIIFSSLTNDIVSSHGYPSNDISVWRTNGLKRVVQLSGHDARPLHMCLSPDATTLASAASDETLRFWKLYDMDILGHNDTQSAKSLRINSAKTGSNNRAANYEESDDSYNEAKEDNETPDKDENQSWDPPGQEYFEQSDFDLPASVDHSDCSPES